MLMASPKLVRTVAVVVVMPMAAAASAADLADTTRDPEIATAATLQEETHGIDARGPSSSQSTWRHSVPFVLGLAPLTRVRIVTLPPSDVRGSIVGEDSRSVLLTSEPNGERFALSKAGCRLEGQIGSIDGDSITLLSKTQGSVRVRRQDIVRLRVPGEGSPFLATVGGLLGFLIGSFVAAGPYMGSELEEAPDAFCWFVGLGGAVLGGAILGQGGWKTIRLPRDDRFSLAIKPTRGGAAAGLSVRF